MCVVIVNFIFIYLLKRSGLKTRTYNKITPLITIGRDLLVVEEIVVELLGIFKHSISRSTRLADLSSTILDTEIDHVFQILLLEVQRNVLVGESGGGNEEISEVDLGVSLSGELVQEGGLSPLVDVLSSGVHFETGVLGVVGEGDGGVGTVNNVDNDLGVIGLDFSASFDDVFNIGTFDPASVDEGVLVVNSILEKGWDGRGEEGGVSSEVNVVVPILLGESDLSSSVDVHGDHDTHSLVGVGVKLVGEVGQFVVVVDQGGLEEKTFEVTAGPVDKNVSLGGGLP